MQDGVDPSGYLVRRFRRDEADVALARRPAEPTPAERAHAEAEKIIADARALAELILDRADETARERAAEIEAQARRRIEASQAEEVLACHRQLQREIDLAHADLVGVVRDCVETILGEYPRERLAERLIRKALDTLGRAKPLLISAAPADVEILRAVAFRLSEADGLGAIRVQPDPDLAAGDCRLEMGGLILDVGVETQLAALDARLRMEDDSRFGRKAAPDG
jgi:flagellar biosynthesis/type III secretory pathway protein FliH